MPATERREIRRTKGEHGPNRVWPRSIYQTAISSRIGNPRPLYQPRNYITTNIEMKAKLKSLKDSFRPRRNDPVSLLRAP